MLVTLYKNSGVHFPLLGTNGFHVKAKNERSTTGKRGHIVADTLLLMMFLGRANARDTK